MGKIFASGGGGGAAGSDDCTATKAEVRNGYTAVVNGSDDEVIEGTMPDNGAVSKSLNCGEKYTVPLGYHDGSGVITANSLASQTQANATAGYIYPGKTAWVNGSKITGNMSVSSVTSFSVAAYSTSQVLAKWANPGNGHPFSGVIICAKTGGYPTDINDNRKYTGIGSNSSAGGVSSVTIGGLTSGATYYFRIWAYVTCSAGNLYSGYQQATCAPTAHGRKAFTSSGTFTVPSGVRSINIHCTGGGGSGNTGIYSSRSGGCGGGGGRTYYKNNISVSPNQSISVVVGAGGSGGGNSAAVGGTSSVTIGNSKYSAYGGNTNSTGGSYAGQGGSGGGGNGLQGTGPGGGGSNGGNGGSGYGPGGTGQGTTTKEFGSGTLYSGGGGGGASNYAGWGGSGGSGGGGAGSNGYGNSSAGSAGTGGGGGGGGAEVGTNNSSGGSGNVIITW